MHESEKCKGSRSVVSDSSRPHGPQPTRLLCPCGFPGKSTGVRCHCLLWQDLLELTPKKDVFFVIGDWNAKVGSQEIPGVTGKFGLGVQNEAGQRLIQFGQENTLVITNTLFKQHKRWLLDITKWSTLKSDRLYSFQPNMEKLHTVSNNETGSWPWLRSWSTYCQIQTQIEESRKNH